MSVVHGDLIQVQFAGEADVTSVSAETLVPVEPGYRVVERTDLIRHLLALKFELPLADHIYARNASRARFEAHQFKPALKFFDSGRRRLLIADEVGLGKTIEAGIIMAEVNARNSSPMDRVMVICPSGLKEKWDDELYHRFGEQFTVADSRILHDALDKFEQGRPRFRLIVPLEVIRARRFMDRIASLSATANFTIDMTIVDEAHHLRNPATLSHRVAETIGDISEALLFLTATPVQLGSVDLYHLLSILDEELFPSEHIFDSLVRPNAIVNDLISGMTRGQLQRARAALDRLRAPRQDHAIASSPFFSRVAAVLDGHPTPDQLARAVVDAKELHTLAGIFTRTRKREVQQAALRRAQTVQIELTGEEKAYYEAVGNYVRATAGAAGASFAAVARERQAASCIPASVRYFKEAMAGRDEPAVEGWLTAHDANPGTADKPRTLRELIDLGKKCTKDSKLEAFLTVIRGLLAENPSRKVIVFSFFKHTLRYVEEALRAEGVGYLLINGDVKPIDRADRIRRFRTGSANVLLSSEVGAEGLDFQFCDALVNYDLPWNPMRVEQRIGRLDRYGQKSPSITIVSFVLNKTIEERILARLYDRIGVFEASIGDLEPILGDIVGKLEKDIFSASLTPREEVRIADELVRQIEIRKAQMEQLDGRMDEFIGNDDLIEQVSARKDAGLTIEPRDLQEAVGWLAKSLRSSLRAVAGHEGIYNLSRSTYLASEIRRFLSQRRLQATDEQQDLIDGLDARDVWVVFDGDVATEHPGIKFIGISHPLARLAIVRAQQERLSLAKKPVYRVAVPVEVEPSPAGLFVFRFRYTGGNPGFKLFPILLNAYGQRMEQSLAWSAFGALRLGGPSSAELASQDEFRAMEEGVLVHALEERNRLLAELRDRNDAVIAARANSIRQNFEARIRKRRQWAADADERIRRMRLAEARNLEEKLASHLAQLEEAREVDVDFQLVLRVLVESDMASSSYKRGVAQPARQPASVARS